jgi:hypothetical protein
MLNLKLGYKNEINQVYQYLRFYFYESVVRHAGFLFQKMQNTVVLLKLIIFLVDPMQMIIQLRY